MIRFLTNAFHALSAIRGCESAQRRFLHNIYSGLSRFPADYERPSYLLRARVACL